MRGAEDGRPWIGRRLAELRRSRGLTPAVVAERMGVTKGRVSQIEQGQASGQAVLARHDLIDNGKESTL